MSEEISLKDLMPNEFYINDIGIMCCELSLNEVNNITSVLINLQQENQQLKEKINKAIRFIKRNKSYISIETMEQGLLENDLNKLLQILDKVKE